MNLNLLASNIIGMVRMKDHGESDWCENRLRQEVQLVLEMIKRKSQNKSEGKE